VRTLTVASFLTDASTEMLIHLIPLFLANVLGVRTSIVGVIEGVAETTSSLLKVASGRLSDRIRRRKVLVVAGYALSTIAKPLFAVASSWQAVLGTRFLERVGKGVRTSPRDALIADSTDPSVRGFAFGFHRAGDTFGAALGILLAIGIVTAMQGSQTELTAETFRWIVWLSVIPAAAAVFALIVGVSEPGARRAPSSRHNAHTYGAAIVSPLGARFYLFLGIVVLFTLGNSSDAFLVLRAQERGLSLPAVLGLLLLYNLVYAFSSGPAGILSDRIGRRRLIIASWGIYAAAYFLFAGATSPWHLLVAFAIYGFFSALFEGSAKAFVADLTPADARGTAYGVYNAAVGVAALPASVVAGALWQGVGDWQGFGPAAPFFLGGTLALLAAALLARFPK
jgi:MFS family permease